MTGGPRQRLGIGWYILVAGVVVPAAELASGLLGNPVWIRVTIFFFAVGAFAWFARVFFGTSWARARLRRLLADQENEFEFAPDEIRGIGVDSSGATLDPLIVIALRDERIIRVSPMGKFGFFRPSYSKIDKITEKLNALRVGRASHPAP